MHSMVVCVIVASTTANTAATDVVFNVHRQSRRLQIQSNQITLDEFKTFKRNVE